MGLVWDCLRPGQCPLLFLLDEPASCLSSADLQGLSEPGPWDPKWSKSFPKAFPKAFPWLAYLFHCPLFSIVFHCFPMLPRVFQILPISSCLFLSLPLRLSLLKTYLVRQTGPSEIWVPCPKLWPLHCSQWHQQHGLESLTKANGKILETSAISNQTNRITQWFFRSTRAPSPRIFLAISSLPRPSVQYGASSATRKQSPRDKKIQTMRLQDSPSTCDCGVSVFETATIFKFQASWQHAAARPLNILWPSANDFLSSLHGLWQSNFFKAIGCLRSRLLPPHNQSANS